MARSRAAAVGLAFLAAGCADGTLRRIETDLTMLRSDVAGIGRAQDRAAADLTRVSGQVSELEAQLRELATGLGESRAEVAALRTRLAEAEEATRRARAETERLQQALEAARAERPVREEPRPAAEAAYAAALASFRGREHGQAVLEFQDFLARYPGHPLGPSAQFWIGEAFFVQRDYRRALREFAKVLELGGDGMAPEALLRIGVCHSRLREPERARQAWRRVVTDFPHSDAADRARALLDTVAAPRR